MPVLKPKNADKTRTFSVRLPVDLVAEIDALRNEASDAGFIFDAADIAGKALASAAKAARAELFTLCIQKVNNGESQPAPSAREAARLDAGGAFGRRDEAANANAADNS